MQACAEYGYKEGNLNGGSCEQLQANSEPIKLDGHRVATRVPRIRGEVLGQVHSLRTYK